jgi:hypothetical protein
MHEDRFQKLEVGFEEAHLTATGPVTNSRRIPEIKHSAFRAGEKRLKGHSCGGVATLRHRLLLVRVEVGAENKAGGARVLRDVRNGKLFVGNAAGALL